MLNLIFLVVIVLLIALNVYTVWFYQKQIAILIDKAMSRSYAEYIQTKNLEQGENFPKVATQDEKTEVKDDEVLRELNSIIMS